LFPLWEGRRAIIAIAKEIFKSPKNTGVGVNQNDAAVIPATGKIEEVDSGSQI
jgi:predicted amino acid dehydrogenase